MFVHVCVVKYDWYKFGDRVFFVHSKAFEGFALLLFLLQCHMFTSTQRKSIPHIQITARDNFRKIKWAWVFFGAIYTKHSNTVKKSMKRTEQILMVIDFRATQTPCLTVFA